MLRIGFGNTLCIPVYNHPSTSVATRVGCNESICVMDMSKFLSGDSDEGEDTMASREVIAATPTPEGEHAPYRIIPTDASHHLVLSSNNQVPSPHWLNPA